MLGKKSSEKSAKNVFLYSHEYRDEKMAGTKRSKQFFQKHTNNARKKFCGKNRRKKVRKNFFIFTQISLPKNGWEKTAKQFFQKHKNSAIKKCWEKNRRKKVRKNFFLIFTRKSWPKNGGNKTCETIFPGKHE